MMNAAQYDAWYDSPLGRACLVSEGRLLMESMVFEGSERTLEVGCGTGRFLIDIVMKKQPRIVGVDRDISFLIFAKRKGERLGLHPNLIQADGAVLPFRDGQFDIAYEITTLCFVQDEKKVLDEMIRVSSDNGRILLGELNPVSPWQWWRRLKGWFGYGSFKRAKWHFPSDLKRILNEKGYKKVSIQRAIFFAPLNIRNYLHWRNLFEWVGSVLFPRIGAFYLISATKKKNKQGVNS